jgi:hypothetical protein
MYRETLGPELRKIAERRNGWNVDLKDQILRRCQ